MTENKDEDNIRRFASFIESDEELSSLYTDIELLDSTGGSGEFSIVFKAIGRETRRPLALKFFHPKCFHDSYRLQCFTRESEILERFVGKPNIIQLVQPITRLRPRGQSNVPYPQEYPYLALEYHPCSLRKSLYEPAKSDLAPLQKIRIFRECCKAIQRIHHDGVCHRELDSRRKKISVEPLERATEAN